MGKKNKKEKREIYLKEEGITFFLKKVIFFSSLITLFSPLIISRRMFFPFVAPKSLFFMFFAEIAFFSFLLLLTYDRSYLPKKNIILFSFIGYIVILFLSSIFGMDFQESFWSNNERMTGVLMHLHLFFFFVTIASTFKEKEWKITFFTTLIVSSVISFIALYDRFVGVQSITLRGGSTLGNTSFLGTYLLFNAFIGLYLFLKNKNFYRYIGGVTFVIISLGLIYNTRGRAAFISFIGGIILLILIYAFFKGNKILKIFSSFLILSSIIVSFFGFFIVLNPENNTSEKILEKFNLGTIGGRTIIWEISKKAYFERPLLGWGPENFHLAFGKYYNPCLATDRCGADTLYDKAHNILYDNLVSIGLIGTLSYFFIMISAIFFLWKRYFVNKDYFIEAGIFTSLFIAYFVQGLTVFDMVSSFIMLFLTLSYIYSLDKKEEKFIANKEKNLLIMFVVIILFFFSSNYFVIKSYKANKYVLGALGSQINFGKRMETLDNAIYTSSLGRAHIKKQIAQNILGREKINNDFLKETQFIINELLKETERNSYDVNTHIILGRLYLTYVNVFVSLNEKNISEEIINEALLYVDKAGKLFEKAIEISPNKQESYWYLSEVRVRQGRSKEALILAEKAVELEPQILNSHIYLIKIVKDALRDKELMLQKIDEAKKINPNWDFTPALSQ